MHNNVHRPPFATLTAQATPAVAQPAPAADALSSQEVERLTAAAVKFEAFFVAQMMKQMRQATAALASADSPLKAEVNQAPLAMADAAVADEMAAHRAFGIADVLVRQMTGAAALNTAAHGAATRKLS